MKVYIDHLTFYCIIGILDFERKTKQQVVVDVSFEYNYKNKEFIDYAQVAKIVEKTMKKQKFKLIEEAIIYLEKKLTKKFAMKNLVIKISKPNILNNCIVSVEG